MIPQNISGLFNNARLNYFEWIDVASYLPVQELVLINMSFTPEMLGYPEKNATEVYVNSIITVKFSDLNKVINIELPMAAKEALSPLA
jgi:hypothetical protein